MPSSHVATIERELVPMDESPIQGVTFDGTLVWFARDDELVAFDPQTEKVVKRHSIPGVHASGGAASGPCTELPPRSATLSRIASSERVSTVTDWRWVQ